MRSSNDVLYNKEYLYIITRILIQISRFNYLYKIRLCRKHIWVIYNIMIIVLSNIEEVFWQADEDEKNLSAI